LENFDFFDTSGENLENIVQIAKSTATKMEKLARKLLDNRDKKHPKDIV